jgi:hypothetical protein
MGIVLVEGSFVPPPKKQWTKNPGFPSFVSLAKWSQVLLCSIEISNGNSLFNK